MASFSSTRPLYVWLSAVGLAKYSIYADTEPSFCDAMCQNSIMWGWNNGSQKSKCLHCRNKFNTYLDFVCNRHGIFWHFTTEEKYKYKNTVEHTEDSKIRIRLPPPSDCYLPRNPFGASVSRVALSSRLCCATWHWPGERGTVIQIGFLLLSTLGQSISAQWWSMPPCNTVAISKWLDALRGSSPARCNNGTWQCDTVQKNEYNTIPCNTIQYNEMTCNTMQWNRIKYKTR